MSALLDSELKEQVLEENRRVHSLENAEYLSRHPEQTNRFQQQVLKSTLDNFANHLGNPHSEILDVGCGTGYLYLPLMKRGFRLTGVDLSPTLLDVLEEKIPENKKETCRLVADDIEAFLNNTTQQFDGVVVSALLHHLFDYEAVVKLLCQRLALGGTLLIFFEPLKQEIKSPLRFKLHRMLGGLDESAYERGMIRRGVPLIQDDYEVADYQRQFGGICPKSLTKLIEGQGLRVLETQTYCARRTGWAAWIANNILGTCNTFNILAQKN
ncbi:MAG: class I SAM-dependent methyltransferase [Candidatus Nitronauta litoralis]|uniref:Class I SAM-dependent methyltransferase n=1 Tax=Candidatus Nitronauta litoralis TaxID=2705533 RepID=A0A7T0BVD0_9BACT|nr:MAG: class I SAM-dependent methyltransferase [Candidatus Nitronauta litoralis]